MKPVFVSQRVDIVAQRGERRDSLDQRLVLTLAACGLLAIPIPNEPAQVQTLWSAVGPRGVVLSGGNDLSDYGGDAPERDATERALLNLAVEAHFPVFGVCRGMQMLTDYFGGTLKALPGHAGTRHRVRGILGEFETNSFHTWGVSRMPASVQILAVADDHSVEAWRHADLPICAVMWHPEREVELASHDRLLIGGHFV